MARKSVYAQLEDIAMRADFAARSAELTEAWSKMDFSVEIVDTILLFMESNPTLDYGVPGPLVHYVEEFYKQGYEEKLVASVRKQPTVLTVWMLHRLLNDAKGSKKRPLLSALKSVQENPNADKATLEKARDYLAELTGR